MRKLSLKSITKFLIIISLFSIFSALFIVTLSFDVYINNTSNLGDGVRIVDKARIKYEDGTSEDVNLPITINDEKQITATFEIPEEVKIEGKSISIHRCYNNFELFLDNQSIFKYISKENLSLKSGFCTPEMVDLPYDLADSSSLSIKYLSVLKRINRITINKFYIGDKSKILMHQLYTFGFFELTIFIFSFLILIIISYLTIISIKTDFSNKYIVYLDIICMFLVIYFFSCSWVLKYIFYPGIVLFYILEYSSLMIAPIFTLLVFKDNLNAKFKRGFHILIFVGFGNFILQLFLVLVTDYEFADFITVDKLIALPVILLVFISYFSSDQNIYYNKKRLIMPFIPLIFILLIFLILEEFTRFKYPFRLFYIGIILFYSIECYYLIKEYKKLTAQNQKLIVYEKLSLVDVMTGLKNRTAFIRYINNFDNKQSMWVIAIDINNLKIINDSEGHDVGDQLIKSMSDIILMIKHKFVETHAFRMGGDEFLLFVNSEFNPNLEEIIKVFEEEKIKFNLVPSNTKLFFSLGYSYFDPEKATSLEYAIKIADDNMYDNKAKQKLNLEVEDNIIL